MSCSKDFDEIYKQTNKRLFGAVYSMCKGDRDTAEDVLQTTWLKVHKALPNFNGKSEPYTWIYRIAVNTYLDYIRTAHYLNMQDSEDVYEVDLEDIDDPESLAISMQISDKVSDFLASTDDILFKVFIDKVMRGLSYEEIAEIEQVPIGTVKSRVNRLYKKLRDELTD